MQCPDMSVSILEESDEQADIIGDSWEMVGSTTKLTLQRTQSQTLTQSQSLLRGSTLVNQEAETVGGTTVASEMIDEIADECKDESSSEKVEERGSTLGATVQSEEEAKETAESVEADKRCQKDIKLETDIKKEESKSPMVLLSEIVKGSSPATSTPGSSPSSKGSKEELFNESMKELSKINLKEGEEEDDDIEIIKEIRQPTLYEKSVEENISQEAKEANWRSIRDEVEIEHGLVPSSCIAMRTRSHTEEVRKRETSLFFDENEDSDLENLEESRVIKDSFEKNCRNKEQWQVAVRELDDTHRSALDVVENCNRTLELIESVKREIESEATDEAEIECIDRGDETFRERKRVTFYVDKGTCMDEIRKVTKALENMSAMDNDTLPRRYLESLIKILTTICLDNNYQMQMAQNAIGTMTEVIEDLLRSIEEAKEIKKENRRLDKIIDQLRSDVEHGNKRFNNMLEYTKPGGRHRNAVKELAEMKIDLENAEKRLQEVKNKYIERNNLYEELWAHKEGREEIHKATEKQMETLNDRTKALDKLREAEKKNYESKMRAARNERNDLEKDLLRLGNLNREYLNKIDVLERDTKKRGSGNEKQQKEIKELKKYIERLEVINADVSSKVAGLEKEVINKEDEQKHQLVRKDREWADEIRKKEQEVKHLDDRIKRLNGDQIELKKELEKKEKELEKKEKEVVDTKEQWRTTYDTLMSCNRRAEVAESIISKLEKQLEIYRPAQVEEASLVAKPEKPGPDEREGTGLNNNNNINKKTPATPQKRTDPEVREERVMDPFPFPSPYPIQPSSLHTTTEGNLADSEWDERDNTYVVDKADKGTHKSSHRDRDPPVQSPRVQRKDKRNEWKRSRQNSDRSESMSDQEENRGKRGWWGTEERRRDDNSRSKNEDELERLRRQIENQQREFDRLMKQKDKELKMKERGKVDGARKAPPQGIVEITKENEHLISHEHHGMLLLEDGSLLRTPQYETYQKDTSVQLKKLYSVTPIMPKEMERIRGHPRPTPLDLDWSFRGEWQELPEDPSQNEPTRSSYRAARVEPYIDIDGQKKHALAYGEEAEQLTVWYDLEEVLATYNRWKMPTPSNFFNGQRFRRTARRDWQQNKKDQSSSRGGQRGRGNWRRGGRGRGGWNNYNNYDYDYHSNPQSSGPGRGGPLPDRRDRDREREQQDWEDYQAQRKREREREDQGYYTSGYDDNKSSKDDRKRPRSPSRGDGPSRDEEGYQRQERREQNPERWEQAPERRSRRDYTPEGRRYQGENK